MKQLERITRGIGFKAALVAALVLVMLVPAALVRGVVHERAARADEAARGILDAWGGELAVAGPFIRIPFTRREERRVKDEAGRERIEFVDAELSLWVSPSSLSTDADFDTEIKRRGLFSVPVYVADLRLAARFDLAAALDALEARDRPRLAEAELVIGLGDQRAIRLAEGVATGDPPGGASEGRALSFGPGDAGLGMLSGGIRAPIAGAGTATGDAGRREYTIRLRMQGGAAFGFAAAGENAVYRARGDWPAPSYGGAYLPTAQEHGPDGFDASWELSYLSHGLPLYWMARPGEGARDLNRRFIETRLIEPLDLYALNLRAVKYAILFIVVPFLAFFVMEAIGGARAHPVQYLLAGLAGLVFYLLLLSLSEHLGFSPAYGAAALASAVMMSLYSYTVFRSVKRAAIMLGAMAAAYGYLLSSLRSEDWALLIGSVGAFAALALLMFITRKLDWYGYRGSGEDAGVEFELTNPPPTEEAGDQRV